LQAGLATGLSAFGALGNFFNQGQPQQQFYQPQTQQQPPVGTTFNYGNYPLGSAFG
jgi:hypothetical protein